MLILDREPNGRVVKYNHFELKNITFDEKKFPMLFQKLLYTGFLVIQNSSNKFCIGTAVLIRGWRL